MTGVTQSGRGQPQSKTSKEEALFALVVAKSEMGRAAFLDRECTGKPVHRRGIESRLAADATNSWRNWA
jgi:hypothetical protein